jgi:hypothetical protein
MRQSVRQTMWLLLQQSAACSYSYGEVPLGGGACIIAYAGLHCSGCWAFKRHVLQVHPHCLAGPVRVARAYADVSSTMLNLIAVGGDGEP